MRIATKFSSIGAYENALGAYEIDSTVRVEHTISYAELQSFISSRTADAHSYILDKAANAQILIFNEAHHKPQHRVFLGQLLTGLRALGFQYLGLETLTNCDACDSTLNHNGVITPSFQTGYYTQEPQMANLVRKARKLGFHLFSYERTEEDRLAGLDREYAQARNIMNKTLDKVPQARIVILAGYCHVLESIGERGKNCGKERWMASHLHELSQINPLTIDQEMLTERQDAPEHPFYRMITSDKPVIVLGHGDNPLVMHKHFRTDIVVYHPPSRFKLSRPHWLLERDGAKVAFLPDEIITQMTFPSLVKVLHNGNSDEVPVDIIEVHNITEAKNTALVAEEGVHHIRIVSKDRSIIELTLPFDVYVR